MQTTKQLNAFGISYIELGTHAGLPEVGYHMSGTLSLPAAENYVNSVIVGKKSVSKY